MMMRLGPHMRRTVLNPTASASNKAFLSAARLNKGALANNYIPLTKIVATIGPASENLPMMPKVVTAGMRIMRINFSHATYEEADLRMKNLALSEGTNYNKDCQSGSPLKNVRAVLLDTQGPEIRTGQFASGEKDVMFNIDDEVVLTTDDSVRLAQTPDKIWISYKKLIGSVQPGAVILLDDGAIQVEVVTVSPETNCIACRVLNTGALGNRKGVNLPGLKVDLPAMSAKDKEDIKWGIKNDIDYIAASFVRKAKDVTDIQEFAAQCMEELFPGDRHRVHPKIISKIESTEALENFDSILEVSDGIMVARGDLAVEIPMETLANVQKQITFKCNQVGKPVIVATQMLESMQKSPRPTRAECIDVGNAVYEGADCVMLSGESAKGKYPVQAVSMMNNIILQTEQSLRYPNHWTAGSKLLKSFHNGVPIPSPTYPISAGESMAQALTSASRSMLESDDALACVVVLGDTGIDSTDSLAKYISKYKPMVPVVCVVPSAKRGRMLQMHRGLHPLVLSYADTDLLCPTNAEKLMGTLTTQLRRTGYLHAAIAEDGFVGSGQRILVARAGKEISMTYVTV